MTTGQIFQGGISQRFLLQTNANVSLGFTMPGKADGLSKPTTYPHHSKHCETIQNSGRTRSKARRKVMRGEDDGRWLKRRRETPAEGSKKTRKATLTFRNVTPFYSTLLHLPRWHRCTIVFRNNHMEPFQLQSCKNYGPTGCTGIGGGE